MSASQDRMGLSRCVQTTKKRIEGFLSLVFEAIGTGSISGPRPATRFSDKFNRKWPLATESVH